MLGEGINPESFKQDFSGFARAGEIQGKAFADLGESIGGVLKTGASMYAKQKAFEGQKDSFGKSMDFLAKAFPEYSEFATQQKAAVFNPDFNMYQQQAAMNAFSNNLNTFNLFNTMSNQAKQLEIQGRVKGAQSPPPYDPYGDMNPNYTPPNQ